ncbi:type II secretion system minor pseudopilin GspI [Vibrio ruber]|uniref:Type II secretion system protein I n=1 Tax=Vibrio ruber (strain DSM 16370 / JCM 11486 / BCRC 17186 / CECT 7878 / LMG 23124 / VR1) TaxID=1123498 RepID=A0A1R4LQC6_VIBR1|nr:type II secretion system minor pseudopilin GspI [Vibrio ruber]WNJ96870.1 type II secretion system minor pseudopilin GspI [Vibrio ruber]SJN58547.1 Putative type II secretion system protein I precursor [Vibrio ruber DSM 16370]
MKQIKGMTLLEVLIALAIFATASISVIKAVSQHVNTVHTLEEKMFAAMVVDNQMARIMLAPEKLSNQEGTEEMAGTTWYWKVSLVETSNDVLKAFDVSVSQSKSGPSIVIVRSYVANEAS